MTEGTWIVDDLVEFDKMFETRFDWDAQHTVWMRDLETGGWTLLSTKDDPADLISYAVSSSVYSQSVLVLHGWAAPVNDDDIAPSKHPGRMRVRLYIHIDNGEVAVASRFVGKEVVLMDHPMEGHFMGLIRDAIEFTATNHPDLPASFPA